MAGEWEPAAEAQAHRDAVLAELNAATEMESEMAALKADPRLKGVFDMHYSRSSPREFAEVVAANPGAGADELADVLIARATCEEYGKVKLANREALVADWADAYRGMRHPRPQGWYLHAASTEEARDSVGGILGESGVLAGLAAVSLYDGFAMFDAVYAHARDLALVEDALEAVGAVPVERGANVNVSVPRYKVSAFHSLREFGRIAATSDLQTYLDLQLQPRCGREAAERIMEMRLRRMLNDDGKGGGM